jgi:hypothetical protein
MERAGEIEAGEVLDNIRTQLEEYYGALNEVRMHVRNIPPKKPDVLVIYEMCVKQRLPLVAGGLMDQPHFWLLEQEVIEQTLEMLRSQKLIVE